MSSCRKVGLPTTVSCSFSTESFDLHREHALLQGTTGVEIRRATQARATRRRCACCPEPGAAAAAAVYRRCHSDGPAGVDVNASGGSWYSTFNVHFAPTRKFGVMQGLWGYFAVQTRLPVQVALFARPEKPSRRRPQPAWSRPAPGTPTPRSGAPRCLLGTGLPVSTVRPHHCRLGPAGSKTTMAIRLAQDPEMRARYSDGVTWLSFGHERTAPMCWRRSPLASTSSLRWASMTVVREVSRFPPPATSFLRSTTGRRGATARSWR